MLGRLLKSYENSLVWISNTKVTKYIGNMYISFSSVTLFYKKNNSFIFSDAIISN